VENISEARDAFNALTNAAPPDSIDVWRATIEEAEAARSHSPKAMDVMQSRIKTSQSLKAITAAVMQEDFSSRSFGADGNPNTDWILEGLNIEDEQCVLSSPLSSSNLKDIGFAFGSWCGRQGGIRRLKSARRS
jgi:hypothetical protein